MNDEQEIGRLAMMRRSELLEGKLGSQIIENASKRHFIDGTVNRRASEIMPFHDDVRFALRLSLSIFFLRITGVSRGTDDHAIVGVDEVGRA